MAPCLPDALGFVDMVALVRLFDVPQPLTKMRLLVFQHGPYVWRFPEGRN